MRPARMASSASSIDANGLAIARPSRCAGRGRTARWTPSERRAIERAASWSWSWQCWCRIAARDQRRRADDVLAEHVEFEVHARRRRASADRFVCVHVNGMICTSNASSAERRDRQADAVDGDDALRDRGSGARARRKRERHPGELARRGRTSTTCPMPSTWPCTKWPPNRVSARIARSRLTGMPGPQRAERGHARRLRPDVERHALAVTLDHGQADAVHGKAVARAQLRREVGRRRRADSRPRRGRRLATVPSASIKPVNIAFDQDVVAARFDTAIEQVGGRERAPVEQRHAARPQRASARRTAARDRSYPHPMRPRCSAAPPSSSTRCHAQLAKPRAALPRPMRPRAASIRAPARRSASAARPSRGRRPRPSAR